MVAKKRSMLRHLHQALRGDGVDKRYMALVRGRWDTSKKQVSAPLLKNTLRSGERMVEVTEDGKEALTLFRVLRRFGDFATLVEAKPVTGRTHQIRVHARHAGHSIAGDSKYGDEDFTREVRELRQTSVSACLCAEGACRMAGSCRWRHRSTGVGSHAGASR